MVSMARSNPKARPYAAGTACSVSSVSRSGPRNPRPSQATVRARRMCGQVVAKAKEPVARAVTKYAPAAGALRRVSLPPR